MQKKPIFYHISYLLDLFNFATAVSWFFAYLTLFIKLKREKSIVGLSLQTLLILVVAECNHVLITLIFSLYYNVSLGVDFYLCDCITMILSIATFTYIYYNNYETYEKKRDIFGLKIANLLFYWILPMQDTSGQNKKKKDHPLASKYYWSIIYLIGLIVGTVLFLFRKSNLPLLLSFWESCMDSLLSVALIPQLYMFYNKKPRKISALLAHFVAFILLARLLMLFYWLLYPLFKEIIIPGRRLHISSETLNVLILSNFIYHFIKSKLSGESDVFLPI